MKRTLAMTLPALLLLAACSPGANETRPGPADADVQAAIAAKGKPGCLYPQDVRTWHNSRDGALFVDGGRRKYRVDLWGDCRDNLGVSLVFRGDSITGRVCGNPGDKVVFDSVGSRQRGCDIRDVRIIDDETYALATGTKAEGEGEGED